MLCFQFWSAMNILLGTLLVLVFSSLVATNPINGTSESEDQVGRPYAEFAVFQTFHIQMPTIIATLGSNLDSESKLCSDQSQSRFYYHAGNYKPLSLLI